MIKVEAFAEGIIRRIHQISAYIATLYYLEIVFLMFGILFLYGKAAAIITGGLLALVLTYHVIQLFSGTGCTADCSSASSTSTRPLPRGTSSTAPSRV